MNKIKYFAIFREQAKISEESSDLSGSNLKDVYKNLKKKYHFSLNQEQIKFAVNNVYIDSGYVLKPNDEVVFIPPVAGG